MATIASLDEVEQILATLGERGYAKRLPRRPGQKEDRFMHLLGGDAEPEPDRLAAHPAVSAGESAEEPYSGPSLLERVAALEAEVASLRAELQELRGEPTSVAPDPRDT
jgi:uncharacterized protein YceH (UPF0502 family)